MEPRDGAGRNEKVDGESWTDVRARAADTPGAESRRMDPAAQVEEEPLVSIVTPVYNGEALLARCIESVLQQRYSNWEYVIVNNGSSDRSLEIAHSFASIDKRIRVYSNETFLRVVPNHNHALRQISGSSRYCKMVFADDWIYPDCVKEMVAHAMRHPSVGLVSAYGLLGSSVAWGGLPYDQTVVPGREFCRLKLLGRGLQFGTMTSVLVRSDLVRKREAFFNESNIHADNEACCEVLMESDFGFVHQVLSYTHLEPGSLRSVSQRLNSYLAGEFELLVRFGPMCLSDSEFRTAVDRSLDEYYKFLACSLFPLRDKAFWQFHRRKLAAIGHPLSNLGLCRAALARVVNVALNPKRSVESLAETLRA